jgi:hypothetical protein
MEKIEYKVNEMIVRSAIFMAGTVQAICSRTAKVDGFGRPIYGNYKMVGFKDIYK